MTSSVATRFLETFFRHWMRFLLPLVVCCVLGGLWVTSRPAQYLSVGTLSASPDTLLGNLSNLGGDGGISFDTPAAVTSRRINEQLRSNEFVRAVAERAGLTTALESALIDLDYVRDRVGAEPDGENLLRVGSMTEDPELSVRLTTATIDSFIQSVIDDDLRDSSTAQEFYTRIADQHRAQMDTAQAALDEYLISHPAPAIGERPAIEQSEIAELGREVEQAQTLYAGARSNAEEASLAMELARLDITQRLKLVDPPVRPVVPVTGLRDMVFGMAVFVAVGVLLSLGLVVLASYADKTVNTAYDIENWFDLDVVATVPRVDLPGAPS